MYGITNYAGDTLCLEKLGASSPGGEDGEPVFRAHEEGEGLCLVLEGRAEQRVLKRSQPGAFEEH